MSNKQTATDFAAIYYPSGQCGADWRCSNRGVVLAYDAFSPETATWFCEQCWEEATAEIDWLTIVEDRREQG